MDKFRSSVFFVSTHPISAFVDSKETREYSAKAFPAYHARKSGLEVEFEFAIAHGAWTTWRLEEGFRAGCGLSLAG